MRRLLAVLLSPAAAMAITITADDFNYAAGITGSFYYLTGGTWPGWSGSVDSWDFSGISSSEYAGFDVMAKSASPHGGDFGSADYAERVVQADVGTVWFYSSLNGDYLQHGATLPWLSYQYKVTYSPVIACLDFPLSVGKSWSYEFTYDFWVGFVHVIVNESHSKEIVGSGIIKVPASGGQWWPCLVLRDHAVISDNWGVTNKNVWIYSWLVPDGFIGQSGVASIESVDGAGPGFTNYSRRYVLASSNINPDPWSAMTSTTWGRIKSLPH